LSDYTGVDALSRQEILMAAHNLALMQEYCQSQGREFAFMLAPNKNSLYPDNMPDYGVRNPSANAKLLMAELDALDVNYIDLFAAFGEQEEVLYFTHDSHWNSKGAALGADCINAAFGAESNYFAADFSKAEAVPTLAEIRSETNLCGARICLLPDHLATKENVAYLQNLLMTVYTTCESTDTDRLTAIVSGANGILTADFAALATCFTKYFEKGTIVRPSLIIGHRGNPSLAPENTVEGSLLSYELGAMLVENDIQLTKDGVVVVMHDDTIDRTTNGSGKVTSMTYDQLKQYTVNAYGDFGAQPIPTLEDYLKAFKDLEGRLVIEIKNSDTAICPPLVELLRKYDMCDRVNVISFGTGILTRMKELAP
jgi:hypothetical protein